MSETTPQIAILASGGGTTAEAFIEASQAGKIQVEAGLVISNNGDAGVFNRVQSLNAKYGLDIKTAHISGLTHPKGEGKRGEQTLEESAAICRLITEGNFALVALMGYMKRVRGELLERYGYLPEYGDDIYRARMINTHPGKLPETEDTWGIHTQAEVLRQGLSQTAHTVHLVAAGYDKGPVIAEHPVPVLPSDTSETLFARVQQAEKDNLPLDIQHFLDQQSGWLKDNGL